MTSCANDRTMPVQVFDACRPGVALHSAQEEEETKEVKDEL